MPNFANPMDLKHPLYSEELAKRYSRRIDEPWKLMGNIVGVLAEHAHSENAYLILVSDNGFETNTGVFNLVKWLITKGYMKLKQSTSIGARILRWGVRVARKLGVADLAKRIFISESYGKGREDWLTDSHDIADKLRKLLLSKGLSEKLLENGPKPAREFEYSTIAVRLIQAVRRGV